MLEQYNEGFEYIRARQKSLEPGDPGYDENWLLLDKYTLTLDSSLDLNAPTADSYAWAIFKVDIIKQTVISVDGIPYTAEEVVKTEVNLARTTSIKSSSLILPKEFVSKMETGTYELRLVVFKNGYRYKDSAQLYVVEPFYEFF
ncbi:MAG: hypothetical protein KBT11_08725 [Treponema sp.]|nr:hypothetical protein [Candidatus Treponema equifaecale]